MQNRNTLTLEIVLGIAKFYKKNRYLTHKQEVIINFNVCGGLPNFKNLVLECNLVGQIQEALLNK